VYTLAKFTRGIASGDPFVFRQECRNPSLFLQVILAKGSKKKNMGLLIATSKFAFRESAGGGSQC
jgi:hypothetical protein